MQKNLTKTPVLTILLFSNFITYFAIDKSGSKVIFISKLIQHVGIALLYLCYDQ